MKIDNSGQLAWGLPLSLASPKGLGLTGCEPTRRSLRRPGTPGSKRLASRRGPRMLLRKDAGLRRPQALQIRRAGRQAPRRRRRYRVCLEPAIRTLSKSATDSPLTFAMTRWNSHLGANESGVPGQLLQSSMLPRFVDDTASSGSGMPSGFARRSRRRRFRIDKCRARRSPVTPNVAHNRKTAGGEVACGLSG